jgi:hypothetical protein
MKIKKTSFLIKMLLGTAAQLELEKNCKNRTSTQSDGQIKYVQYIG